MFLSLFGCEDADEANIMDETAKFLDIHHNLANGGKDVGLERQFGPESAIYAWVESIWGRIDSINEDY